MPHVPRWQTTTRTHTYRHKSARSESRRSQLVLQQLEVRRIRLPGHQHRRHRHSATAEHAAEGEMLREGCVRGGVGKRAARRHRHGQRGGICVHVRVGGCGHCRCGGSARARGGRSRCRQHRGGPATVLQLADEARLTLDFLLHEQLAVDGK